LKNFSLVFGERGERVHVLPIQKAGDISCGQTFDEFPANFAIGHGWSYRPPRLLNPIGCAANLSQRGKLLSV
jgi:hypothetical protein